MSGPLRPATELARLPLMVTLTAGAGALMLLPAGYALGLGDLRLARIFGASGAMVLVLAIMAGLAVRGNRGAAPERSILRTMLAVMVLLPVVLALPLAQALPDTGLFNAWWEMVSALTTTGATLYAPELLLPPVHLWRGLVGWAGGLFVLVTAISVLAPLRLGGFEILAPSGEDASATLRAASAERDSAARIARSFVAIAPVYAGLTAALYVALLMAGDAPLVALMRAMGTLSTSGIAPVAGGVGASSGLAGEILVAGFLVLALSRRFWPGGGALRASPRVTGDPELRMALAVVLAVAVALFARHFVALTHGEAVAAQSGLAAAWGGFFNALSYLTTTGWNSTEWEGARAWSGLSAPGLLLAGLAIMGGGVATTAGGVKLLRVYALARQSQRELERMIHPHSVAGGGAVERRLREKGAFLAFIFFMLFAVSIAATVVLVSLWPVPFDTAVILSIAALTNTGPLASTIPLIPVTEASAGLASAPFDGWSGLAPFTKSVLAGAMIVGRLETLAILAMFAPDHWRR
ncbi:MAG: potassium transporter TrkG [Paracoccus sp. (in: a-proteobacteria)]|nr:potassium transporter TrkG [Paracoccus sp. (in: a-proteobacteria)]